MGRVPVGTFAHGARNMRKFKVISASLVAASSFGFAACGDDETPGTDGAVETTPDTTSETATEISPDTTPETTPDTTEVTDPCTPNPCTAKAAICNASGEKVTYGAGVCDAGDCTYPETVAACGADETCNAGECIGAGNACDYVFDRRISYVTSIEIAPASPPAEACCFDFNGDSTTDNKLGSVLALVGNFAEDFDVNQLLADQIADGGLVLLLEAKNVTDVANASGVTLNGFYGADGDADTTNNASGTAEFIVNPSSFVEGTSAPLISFAGASIVSSVLNAGPSVFALSIPVLGAALDLRVDGTRIEGSVAAGLDGADGGLKMGDPVGASLGGYVATSNVAAAFNTYLDASCSCITKIDTAKPYVGTEVKANAEQLVLNIGKGDACTEEAESTCASIAQYIGQGGLASTLIGPALAPDVDGNNDGLKESISVGVRVKATSARIIGVDSCTP